MNGRGDKINCTHFVVVFYNYDGALKTFVPRRWKRRYSDNHAFPRLEVRSSRGLTESRGGGKRSKTGFDRDYCLFRFPGTAKTLRSPSYDVHANADLK